MRGNEMIINNVKHPETGKPIVLNAREAHIAQYTEAHIRNALGYEVPITTLTAIIKRITEQKFATLPFADYMPVVVGEGAWMTNMIKYRSFSIGDNFESGIINTGANSSVLAKSNSGVDSVPITILNWANEISYTIFDIQQAAVSGNWDIVEQQERARKQNWDLGLQRVSFLGMNTNPNITGLLTLPGITSNLLLITQYVSSFNTDQFNTFTQGIVNAYQTNCAFTAMPDRFIMPQLDYNGLVSPVSPQFPTVNKLTYLLEAFRIVTRNPNFEIMPCFYADKQNNITVSGLNKNRYTLTRYDQDSLSMNIPVDYNATQQNTVNGFSWQNVGYGQFTGVNVYRPLETLYFDF